MLKLRARSRSFGSKDDTKSQKVTRGEFRQESSGGSICGSADDINIKPSSSNNNTSSRVEFPLELARSLQAFATSLSPQASTSRSVLKEKPEPSTVQQALLPSSTLPIAPLKPILRSSTSSSVTAEGKQDSRAGRTASSTHHRQNSSVSSTASSKQITFLLPESPTSRSSLGAATSSAAGPGSRYAATAAAARGHCRQSSASSSTSSKKRVSIASTASSSNLKTQQKLQKVPASLVPGPVPASKIAPLPQEDIIHIQRTSSVMHARKSSDTPEVRRSSIGECTRSRGRYNIY